MTESFPHEEQADLFSEVGDLSLVRFLLADLHDDLQGKVPGKATAIMARIIVDAYKPWVVHLKAAEGRLRDQEQKVAKDLAKAFATDPEPEPA